MIQDAVLPASFDPPARSVEELQGVLYSSARWTPEDLQRLLARVRAGRSALEALSNEALFSAWTSVVEEFRNPESQARRELDPILARTSSLSAAGLCAALDAVLGGVASGPTQELMQQAGPRSGPRGEEGPVLVILASNLPALVVQPLLPALVLRQPVILKSPSAEPFFAPAFVRALASKEPALGGGIAAVNWPGGRADLESPLLAGSCRVIAYGEQETLDDLERRSASPGAPSKLVGYGPKASLAVLGEEVDEQEVAPALARDIALFDQRGCLSIQAVFTYGDPVRLAEQLAGSLIEQADHWPPGPLDPVAAAVVQQVRAEARMRGLIQPTLALAAGTVIVEPEMHLMPSPGLRTVRIHPVDTSFSPSRDLASWAGRLQGAALAGESALSLRSELEALGVSRICPPGELQSPNVLWHNGGLPPLEALGTV